MLPGRTNLGALPAAVFSAANKYCIQCCKYCSYPPQGGNKHEYKADLQLTQWVHILVELQVKYIVTYSMWGLKQNTTTYSSWAHSMCTTKLYCEGVERVLSALRKVVHN